jgi:sugar/nucleoside kinase (ribokinase family)
MSEVSGVYDEASTGSLDRLDLIVVGAASRDVTPDDPRGWRLGGAVSYASLTAARLGLRVGCVMGVDEPAAGATELDLLEAAGVVVHRVPLEHGPVFENIERDGHRRQRWLSKSDAVPVTAIPREWLRARGWLLGPVAGEAADSWAEVAAARADACVAVGWQGLLREFAADGWVRRVGPGSSPLLEAAGLVCASLADVAPGASLGELREFAPRAALVLTAGAGGGVALRGATTARYGAIAAPRVVDPTGAGDVFLAALMAAWLLTGELATARALRFAAAAGSCAVEGVGLAGVPTRAQVAARLRSGAPAVETARGRQTGGARGLP